MDERSPLGQWVTSIRAPNVIIEVGGWRKRLVIPLISPIFLPKKTKNSRQLNLLNKLNYTWEFQMESISKWRIAWRQICNAVKKNVTVAKVGLEVIENIEGMKVAVALRETALNKWRIIHLHQMQRSVMHGKIFKKFWQQRVSFQFFFGIVSNRTAEIKRTWQIHFLKAPQYFLTLLFGFENAAVGCLGWQNQRLLRQPYAKRNIRDWPCTYGIFSSIAKKDQQVQFVRPGKIDCMFIKKSYRKLADERGKNKPKMMN